MGDTTKPIDQEAFANTPENDETKMGSLSPSVAGLLSFFCFLLRESSNLQDALPLQQPESVPNPQVHLPPTVSRTFIFNPRWLLAFLFSSLLALILYGSVSSPIVQDLHDSEDDDDDDKARSFLFPLYRKWRTPQKGVELKLGSFVDMDKGDLVSLIEDEVGDPKTKNLLASNKKVDSSSILLVRGNVYPDQVVPEVPMVNRALLFKCPTASLPTANSALHQNDAVLSLIRQLLILLLTECFTV
ncbi:hypothetical protein CFP56_005601 [Quercus suber]|uniref:Uncharacterized protein n=1 Tax=Quercus suber TaxID=58331 RepID=A0AAW0L8L7_QUESU